MLFVLLINDVYLVPTDTSGKKFETLYMKRLWKRDSMKRSRYLS